MKKVTLIMALMSIIFLAKAQQVPNPYINPLIKKIEVKGTAEMEIIPDEIYLRLALKEYKDGSKKVPLDKLESELVKAVSQLGLPKESLEVDNIYGFNWDPRKKKSDDFMATKSFRLKVSNVKMVNDLIEKLDPEGVNNIGISEVSHSKIEEYKNELKLKALKAAKEKATYLLKGIDEALGSALEIQEIDYGGTPVYARSNYAMKSEAASDNYQSDLEYKTIQIKAEVRAVFEIE